MLRQGSYWVLDMNQMCYDGPHSVLALAYGVPWLVLFCLGVPFGTALLVLRWGAHRPCVRVCAQAMRPCMRTGYASVYAHGPCVRVCAHVPEVRCV